MAKLEFNKFAFDLSLADSVDEAWNDINTFIRLLQKYEYVSVVRTEIQDSLVIVEFEHDENIEVWGTDNPRWITEDEWQDICNKRYEENEEFLDEEENENNGGIIKC